MNEKRTIKKSLVLSKEVIRLYTYESISQFKTPVRPLISRLTPIPVSFVCLFLWLISTHKHGCSHICIRQKMTLSFTSPLTQKHKQTDHTTAQSNSVFGPAGISKSPGDISLTCLTSEDLSQRTFHESKNTVSVFQLRFMFVSLNILL